MATGETGQETELVQQCVQSIETLFGIQGIDPHMVAVVLMAGAGAVVHFAHTRLGKARWG